jgi:phosphoesterase RecJ-like protein
MENEPQDALAFLDAGERFLVSTHVNPDGDGIGSALALAWLIDRLGKSAVIVIDSVPPTILDYLANYDTILQFGTEGAPSETFDQVVIVDAPFVKRLGGATALIADNAQVLIIDHHPTDDPSDGPRYIDQSASSSAELVYRLICAANIPIDKQCAEYLYTGMLIDTGRFRFSNTSPATLRAAADLLEAGVSPDGVAERLFYHNTIETTKALGVMIETLQIHLGGKLATVEFSYEYLTSPAWSKVDTEGFVNHALAVIGVEVAMLMREVKPGVTRTSLRAKHDFDVNRLAHQFGGGGHAKAAGLTIEAPLAEAKETLIDAVAARLAEMTQ